jgi:hypothetical protein
MSDQAGPPDQFQSPANATIISHGLTEGETVYTPAGYWQPVVGDLIRWLRANSCWEYVNELERHAQSVSSMSYPQVELEALEGMIGGLKYIHNNWPQHLTSQQNKELKVRLHRAITSVNFRRRQLHEELDATAKTTEKLTAAIEAFKAAPNAQRNTMRLDGASWVIKFGQEQGTFPAADYAALQTVAKLVTRPHQPQELKDLVDPDVRKGLELPEGNQDVFQSDEAIKKLKERYQNALRDKERASTDTEKAECEQELTEIAAQVKRHTRPGGKLRKFGKTNTDRAWDALTKGLQRLWPRLSKAEMPQLAKHLERCIHLDRPHIIYHPSADTPSWETESISS